MAAHNLEILNKRLNKMLKIIYKKYNGEFNGLKGLNYYLYVIDEKGIEANQYYQNKIKFTELYQDFLIMKNKILNYRGDYNEHS